MKRGHSEDMMRKAGFHSNKAYEFRMRGNAAMAEYHENLKRMWIHRARQAAKHEKHPAYISPGWPGRPTRYAGPPDPPMGPPAPREYAGPPAPREYAGPPAPDTGGMGLGRGKRFPFWLLLLAVAVTAKKVLE